MGELYEPYPKLPKNIRQIGDRDDIVRVYVEDYVNTYLKRLLPRGGQDLRIGLLLGNTEEHGGIPYVFLDGAVEMDGVTEEGEKVVFTEEAWKKAYQMVEEMFPRRTVQGWFLCGVPGCQLSPLNYWKQHSQYFAGKNKLMYLNSGLEGEEALYITSSDGFYKLRGHCIYYERNQMMQDYMVLSKDTHRVENGGSDPVIRDFRRKMEQKKETAREQSHAAGFLKGMCGCLALLALAGGVAAFNSAEKMKEMEAVMASVLPDADAVSFAGKESLFSQTPGSGEDTPEFGTPISDEGPRSGEGDKQAGVIVEEASGNVFPTAAAADAGLTENTTTNREDTAESGSPAGSSSADAGSGSVGSSASDGDSTGAEGAADSAASGLTFSSGNVQSASGQNVYVVQEGETLYGICFKLYQNLSRVKEICELNGLEDVNKLEAGRKLIIP